MASRAKVRTTFLIISDTHELELSSTGPFRLGTPAQKVDVLIHCGDFTNTGSRPGFAKAFGLLSSIPADLKLVVPGNHDLTLDEFYMQQWAPDVLIAQDNECPQRNEILEQATQLGIHILSEGTHTISLPSGARLKLHASPYTPRETAASISAFQYASPIDSFNAPSASRPAYAESRNTEASVIDEDIDILITHGPPQYVLDTTPDSRSAGCPHLRRAVIRSKPLLHCFGHIHSGWGVQRVPWKSRLTASEIEELTSGMVGGGNDDEDMVLLRDFWGKGQSRRKRVADLTGMSGMGEVVKGRQTLFVNAAIGVDGEGRAENAPVLVALEMEGEGQKGLRDA